jgi:hypothetical protein
MNGPGLPMPAVDRTGARSKVPDRRPDRRHDRTGVLTTRPVVFSSPCLFVNANVRAGHLRVEILDADGTALRGYGLADCHPITGDSTRHPVTWAGRQDLAPLTGRSVRLRFHLGAGELYAFWVSPDRRGASQGYVAAGGPGFTCARDTTGA